MLIYEHCPVRAHRILSFSIFCALTSLHVYSIFQVSFTLTLLESWFMYAAKVVKLDLDNAGTHIIPWEEAKKLQAAMKEQFGTVLRGSTRISKTACPTLETMCSLKLSCGPVSIPFASVPELYEHITRAVDYKTWKHRSTKELMKDPKWRAAHPDRVRGDSAASRSERAAVVVTAPTQTAADSTSRADVLSLATAVSDSGTSALFDALSRPEQERLVFVVYKTGAYTYDGLAEYLHVSTQVIKNNLCQYRKHHGIPPLPSGKKALNVLSLNI